MLNGNLVIDGVAHTYNFASDNLVGTAPSDTFRTAVYRQHVVYSPREPGPYLLTPDEFIAECKPEWVAGAMFAESPVDMTVYHAVPLFDFFKDGISSLEKGIRLRELAPHRVLVYGTCNPLEGRRALDVMELQVREFGVDGFKFYPAVYYGGHTIGWRMDDARVAFPLFEKALELGITNVAVHKAIPLGPTQTEPFTVDDLTEAATTFPQLNFQIVHGGIAFLEETAMLIKRFPNVFINLESTMSYVCGRPRFFAEALGALLYDGTPEQLIFATGCNLVHPRPIIEAFDQFQMPADLVEGFAYPQVTDDMKRLILGGNLARLHGIDVQAVAARISGDEYEESKRNGYPPPWSALRGAAAVPA